MILLFIHANIIVANVGFMIHDSVGNYIIYYITCTE